MTLIHSTLLFTSPIPSLSHMPAAYLDHTSTASSGHLDHTASSGQHPQTLFRSTSSQPVQAVLARHRTRRARSWHPPSTFFSTSTCLTGSLGERSSSLHEACHTMMSSFCGVGGQIIFA
ncbi:hypothetical protein HBH99_029390 [Parastagonospora nodorum]|nr:hypothetical protein HBH49_010350 [Parastagonospora nodorum]KAH4381508.1 hypothetical protein HBH97_086300 [Parastagonospora nodorum]KAH4426106.1 hypothetical protein HBH99_029390 [Parastagonospora nodorum]KAH6282627.1 hypothetical protein HBI41_011650 [Parastagonospora nodorum]